MSPYFFDRKNDSDSTERESPDFSDAESNKCDDAIAIIGLSLEFPSANSADNFWDLIVSGRSAARNFPPERVNHAAWHNAEGSRQGMLQSEKAYFLERDIAAFDAPFFSITADEAVAMDPQQRGLLETTYKALENAGLPISEINGTSAAVFTGCFTADYLLLAGKDPEKIPKYSATGSANAMLSNRLSSFFNLKGPSVTVDTACSSSLVALDMACQTLRRGESSLGIVTGCNLIYTLDYMIGLSNMGFLSPDGFCHSFDERANGYSRGEGFAALVVKPLHQALQHGDTIRAVIRATGSNQNGLTSLATPSKEAQIRLIRDTYKHAKLDMSLTHFVEAHGTGTATGDPIEATAIGEAFGHRDRGNGPLFIGASKANVGHLEGVSGLVGIIKTVLVLERGIIPPIATLENINPAIDAGFLNLSFPKECIVWPTNGPRRASVNSFGFGGTNSHAILDDAYHFLQKNGLKGYHCTHKSPTRELQSPSQKQHRILSTDLSSGIHSSVPQVFVWSAADNRSLERLLSTYQSYLEARVDHQEDAHISLAAIASTLFKRRTLLPWRSFAVAETLTETIDLVASSAATIRSRSNPKLGMVFTGQGAEWLGMGRELLAYPVYRRSLDQADAYLESLGCIEQLSRKFIDCTENQSSIHDPQISQPLCTILQVALVNLLRSFDVNPAVVVGHSSGEIAAAYAAGVISCESAWKLAYYRGALSSELIQRSTTSGAMIAAALTCDDAESYIEQIMDKARSGFLSIACINSPSNVTISGNQALVEQLKTILDGDRVFSRVLSVPIAYHSSQMLEIASSYAESIGSLEGGNGGLKSIPMISSVTGQITTADELLKPSYWVQNMVSPVRFADAIGVCCTTCGSGVTKKIDLSHRNIISVSDLLEIGPHSTLQSPIKETIDRLSAREALSYGSALLRHKSAVRTLMQSMGNLHCLGHPVNITKVNAPDDQKATRAIPIPFLPEYPFDHSKKYWHESRISTNMRFRKHKPNDFLGSPVSDWNPLEPRWRHFLTSSLSSSSSWIRDHKINGDVLFPAAGMLVMALEAITQITEYSHQDIAAYEIKDAEFLSGLAIPGDETGLETQICLKRIGDSSKSMEQGFEFCLYAYQGEGAFEVCRGNIRTIQATTHTPVDAGRESYEVSCNTAAKIDRFIRQNPRNTTGSSLYNRLYKLGYHFGTSFRRIEHVHYEDTGEAVGRISMLEDQSTHPTVIHPASLDGILQMMLPAVSVGGNAKISTMVPSRVSRIWISNTKALRDPTSELQAHVDLRFTDPRSTESMIYAIDPKDGVIHLEVDGIETKAVTDRQSSQDELDQARRLCWDMVSKPDVSFLNRDDLRKLLTRQRSTAPDPSALWHDIRAYVSALIAETLKKVDVADIPSHLPHLARQLDWMKDHLNTDLGTDSDINEISSRLQQHGRLGEVYTYFGHHLSSILKGECDALELLSQDNFLHDYYEIIHGTLKFFDSMKLYVELLCHKNPSLKVLEVGAGTGTTTKHLLEPLTVPTSQVFTAKYSRLDFTDISASFLARAEESFSSYPKIHYGLYDVEKDPAAQGFEEGSYDLLVASNVLHATKSLDVTLSSLRKALKKDGKLLLIEMTDPDFIVVPIIFGCLPGWWQSVESYRSRGPLITEQQWNEVLIKNGFSGIDVVAHDYDNQDHFMSFMISTAKDDAIQRPLAYPSTCMINGFQENCHSFISQLVEKQINCTEFQTGTFQDAVSSERITEQLVILAYDQTWPNLDRLDESQYHLFHSVLTKAKSILWISEYSGPPDVTPQQTLMIGLARTLRLERSGLVFPTLMLGEGNANEHAHSIAQALQNTIQGIETGVYEPELMAVNGVLTIPRIYEDDELNQTVYDMTSSHQKLTNFGERNLNLKIRSAGLLDSLYFEQVEDDIAPLGNDELEIEVKAVGVNFKDVLVALGNVKDNTFGTECSGMVLRSGSGCQTKPGDFVVTSHLDTFRRTIRCKQSAVQLIPPGLSLTEAAAIPTNFITAYRGLIELARLSQNETVLIHAGAGGTGQAAIQIAQYCQAKIFVTVGSEKKKELLIQLYNIPANQILFSRDLSFAKGVKRLTDGQGVDVVFNSLSGSSLVASWECIAPYGRFIEIGKRDITARHDLPMFRFAQNVTFSAIDVAAMTKERPELVSNALRNILELFGKGVLRPVFPMKAFSISQVEEAFRFLQSGKNAGKVVIDIDHHAQVPAVLKTTSQRLFAGDSTFVVAGGLGGQGRSVARWLVSKGARHLLLLSRSGASNKTASTFLQEMRLAGVNVHAPACDITDFAALENVLKDCKQKMPPIRGCMQSSMVIRDNVFERMSVSEWNQALLPKVTGSWNLHKLLPRDLDFFVFLSSLTAIIGAQIQANYTAGNAFEDALARHRIARGEKAISLNLSVMESEGALADHRDVLDQIVEVKQLLPMSQPELFAILDQYCQTSPTRGQIVTGLGIPSDAAARGAQQPVWMGQPMFSHLHQLSHTPSTGPAAGDEESNGEEVSVTLQSVRSAEEAAPILMKAITKKICRFLSISQSDFDESVPLHTYGIDSLIATELRSWLLKTLKVQVSVFEILGGSSAQTLVINIASKYSGSTKPNDMEGKPK